MDENAKRLKDRLDRTYAVVLAATAMAPWGQLAIDATGSDIVSLVFGDDSIVPLLSVVALIPLCVAAVLLTVRFKQRRGLLAIALGYTFVVTCQIPFSVFEWDNVVTFLARWMVAACIVVAGFVIGLRWFTTQRATFGRAPDAALEAGYADPFWPAAGPIGRSQLDLVYACLAWASFGWQLTVLMFSNFGGPLPYFAFYVLPTTAIVAAMTALLLALRCRFRVIPASIALIVLVGHLPHIAMLTGGSAPSLVSEIVVLAAPFQILGVVAGFIASAVWVFRTRLRRETFEPETNRKLWAEAGTSTLNAPSLDRMPLSARGPLPFLAGVVFWGNVLIIVAIIAVFLGASVWLFDIMGQEFRAFARDEPAVLGNLAPMVYGRLVAGAYVFLLAAPPLLIFPVAAIVAIAWRQPRTIVLLRRFHQGRESRALARLFRRDIGRSGHVYSLADSDMHVPWYVGLSALLGHLAVLNFGYVEVSTPHRLARLVHALSRPWWRSVNWMVSWSKIFPVSSTNDGWQTVVRTLVGRADLIVIDLSQWSEALCFELDLCTEETVRRRVVCVARRSSAAEARALLAEKDRWRGLPLRTYSEAGCLDEGP